MTDFTLAGKCGAFAASGFSRSAAFPRGGSNDANAREPKPWAARSRTSRRVTAGRKWRASLRNIKELIAIEQRQAKIGQSAAGLEEFAREPALHGPRRTGERQTPCGIDLAIAVLAARFFEPCGECLRNLLHEV